MRRLIFVVSCLIAVPLVFTLIGGCGSSRKEGALNPTETPAFVSNDTCTNSCHAATNDPVTGTGIVADWTVSLHNNNPFQLVDCQGCHGPGGNHFGLGPIPYPDPDTSFVCFNCHKAHLNTAHFNNFTGSSSKSYPAMYASKNYQNSCKSCHYPHNPHPGQEHLAWTQNHGNVNDVPFAVEDFKSDIRCLRCHTSTGYINFVSSGYTLATSSWATAGDFTREVITCKVCHTNYNFKSSIRVLPKVVAPYNDGKNPKTFPNQNASNLCIACHSGRQSAESVRAVTDFTNASVPTSHYLGAAATFYGLTAFHYYTSNVKYNTGYNIGADTGSWSHGKLGLIDPATGTNFLAFEGATIPTGVAVDSGNRGPCVTCHLGNATPLFPNFSSHTFNPFNVARSTSGPANGCYGCHVGADLPVVAAAEKAIFDADMDLFKFTLASRGIYFTDTRPNFRNGTGSSAAEIKNWVTVSPPGGSGVNTMGAAFNFYLLLHDLGMHVHNRSYVRLLIFDSIQYLQNGAVFFSNQGTTINYYQNGVPKSIVIARSGGTPDINSQISFTAYSTAVFGATPTWTRPAGLASISAMKGHLVRLSTGNYFRR